MPTNNTFGNRSACENELSVFIDLSHWVSFILLERTKLSQNFNNMWTQGLVLEELVKLVNYNHCWVNVVGVVFVLVVQDVAHHHWGCQKNIS